MQRGVRTDVWDDGGVEGLSSLCTIVPTDHCVDRSPAHEFMETVVEAVAAPEEFLETVVETVAAHKEFLETVVEIEGGLI